jgi:peptide deformylase
MRIVQKDEKVLRETAKEVRLSDITSEKIKKIVHSMKQVMTKEVDGVALAAPQIGISLRIFVVSKPLVEQSENIILKK